MKKLFIAIILICFGVTAWAMHPAFHQMVGSGEVGSCPSYHASAIISMDFDHDSGVLNACDSAGDAVLFTDSSSDIGATGETSNGMTCDDGNEYIYFIGAENLYANGTAAQTLCVKIYISGVLDNPSVVTMFRDEEGDDFASMVLAPNPAAVSNYYVESGTDQNAWGAIPIPTPSWEIVGISWDQANNDHSANSGDQGTWADGWAEDNELADAMTDNITRLYIGTVGGDDPGDTESFIIDEWAIFSGYEVDCSSYMN